MGEFGKLLHSYYTFMKILCQISFWAICGLPAHAQVRGDDDLRNLVSGLTAVKIYEAFDAVSRWAMLMGLVIAVIAYASAGIAFFFSRGDQARLATAKKTAAYATLGTVLIVVARGITVMIGAFFQ